MRFPCYHYGAVHVSFYVQQGRAVFTERVGGPPSVRSLDTGHIARLPSPANTHLQERG